MKQIECIITDDDEIILKYRVEDQIKWLKKNKAKIIKKEQTGNTVVITYKI